MKLGLIMPLLLASPLFGQARVVSAPSEPSLLNLTAGWARASSLGDLRETRMRSDDVELRVWRGFAQAETQAIVLRRTEGHWSAWLGRVIRCEIQIPASVGDTASAVTMHRFIVEARRGCGRSVTDVGAGTRIIATDTLVVQPLAVPEPEIQGAWEDAVSAGLLRLPARVKRSRPADDGVMYLIELRQGEQYRAAELEHLAQPEVDVDGQVERVYAAVRRLLAPSGR